MRPLRAGLSGYHGMRNLGDDLFFRVLVTWIDRHFAPERIEVDGFDAFLPSVAAQARIVGVRTESKWRSFGRRWQELRLVLRNDLVIFGGGSLFQRRDFFWLFATLFAARLSDSFRRRRRRIAAVGVSLGPFRGKWDRFWLQRAFRRLDLVQLRDRSDRAHGITLTAERTLYSHDLAFAIELPQRSESAQGNAAFTVGLTLVDRDTQHGRPEIDRQKKAAIIDSLLDLKATRPDLRLQIFVFCSDPRRGDEAISRAFAEEVGSRGIPVEVVPYTGDIHAVLQGMSQCDFLFCNRMHSHILACLLNVPCVALAYEEKMRAFADAHGLDPRQIVDVRELTGARLTAAVRVALDDQQNPESRLAAAREQTQADLERAAERLADA